MSHVPIPCVLNRKVERLKDLRSSILTAMGLRDVEQQSEPDYGLRTTGGANEWIMTRLLALSKALKIPTMLDCTPMQVFEPHGASALCSSSSLSWR